LQKNVSHLQDALWQMIPTAVNQELQVHSIV